MLCEDVSDGMAEFFGIPRFMSGAGTGIDPSIQSPVFSLLGTHAAQIIPYYRNKRKFTTLH